MVWLKRGVFRGGDVCNCFAIARWRYYGNVCFLVTLSFAFGYVKLIFIL